MLTRIVLESFRRRRKRKMAALAAVALGTGAATGLFMIFLGVGDAVNAEFRANRHNIVMEPAVEGRDLDESELYQIRDTFWSNNIVGFTPFLETVADVADRGRATIVGTWWDHEVVSPRDTRFRTGLKATAGAWRIDGAWSDDGALVGERLARSWGVRRGETLRVGSRAFRVTGIVSTGEEEDDAILVDLAVAQAIAGRPGRVDRALVNAVTTPDSQLVEHFKLDPKSMTPKEYEKLRCTPFATTIALTLAEKFPDAEVRPIRKVTESEGRLLKKIDTALLVLALAAIAAAVLSVMAAMTAAVVDRAKEVGLLKALGATNGAVGAIFLGEAAILGVIGSALGYGLGLALAKGLSTHLFGHAVPGSAVVYLIALGTAVAIAVGGMLWPLRLVLRMDPTRVLHEA